MQIQAAVVRAQGGPFIIESLSLADPAPDEVLVRVVAAGVPAIRSSRYARSDPGALTTRSNAPGSRRSSARPSTV